MEEQFDVMAERLGASAKGQNWIPFANIISEKMKTRGKYAKGYPRGAIVHYTAGQQKVGAGDINWGRAQGYCFLLIDALGVIHQAHPLNEWGWHAGGSSYAGLNGSVSDDLIGIEIACAGICEEKLVHGVKRYKAWFHKSETEYFNIDQVRFSPGRDNIKKGWYQKYTKAQEESLTHLLLWIKENDTHNVFSFDFVLGHDQVSPARKSDPGASLSMSMPEYQKHLKALASS
jgi:N-acetyl-anhydromuramyl-L-alanine amidase AmpD